MEDTARLRILTKLVGQTWGSQSDSTFVYVDKGLQLVKQHPNPEAEASLLLARGNANLMKSRYPVSISTYNEALKVQFKKPRLRGELFSKKGIAYWYLGQFKDALNCYDTALQIAQSVSDERFTGNVYNNIAIVYDRMGDYETALTYHLKSLTLREKINDKQGRATSYVNIGLLHQYQGRYAESLVYFRKAKTLEFPSMDFIGRGNILTNLGQTFYHLNMLDSALYYQQESLKVRKSIDNKIGIAACLHRIALIYIKQNKLAAALDNVQQALQLQKMVGDRPGVTVSLITRAEIFSMQKKYNEAINSAERALAISDSIKTLKNRRDALQMLTSLYASQRRFEKAFEFQQQLILARDSFINEQRNRDLANMEIRYETSKKEQSIAALQQQSQIQTLELKQQVWWRNAMVVGMVVVLLFFGLLYNRYKANQRTNRILEEKNKIIEQKEIVLEKSLGEKELLLREIHHRVKNNLQVISSLLNLQSRSLTDESTINTLKEGQSRVKSMSLIHQKLYQNNDLSTIDFLDYSKELMEYLFSTYKLEGRNIQYHIEPFEARLDVDTAVPLGLILNELISNSLKYAFTDVREGRVNLSMRKIQEGRMQLQVSDNGKGMPVNFDIEKSTSTGLRIVKSLVRQLQAELKLQTNAGVSCLIDFKAV
ncbi:hypothetical protein WSM22_06620 [Cytophagales bacterium WSM2-2]|nr:hypothetical protein WSM22_06620 [Cytophagales bacterium WSM2-2]